MAPTTISLLDLNEYCLTNIFKRFKLGQLLDLVGKLHPRLDNTIEQELHNYRRFSFSMRFPPQYNRDQLQTLGKYIRFLDINVGYSVKQELVLPILQPLCEGAKESGRLMSLKIDNVKLTTDYLNALQLAVPSLVELDFSCCDVGDPDQLTILLKSATQLKMLALRSNDVEGLETTTLGRVPILKIFWILGTSLTDVITLSKLFPDMMIAVFKHNEYKRGPVCLQNGEFVNLDD